MANGTKTGFLSSRYAQILTLALVAEALLYYTALGGEKLPNIGPLSQLAGDIPGGWHVVQEYPIEPEVQEILKADDTLNRLYVNGATAQNAYLFVAFFKTQRAGQAPHSPKNCLPGSGWEPSQDGFIDVRVPGRPDPIRINRYVVSRGEDKSVVLYWYQSHSRVVASEFTAKFWLVADSIRYHRSDTALVRVTVPVRDNDDATATRTGVGFVQTVFPLLAKQLPS